MKLKSEICVASQKTIGVSESIISRELKRNVPKRGTGAKVYTAFVLINIVCIFK